MNSGLIYTKTAQGRAEVAERSHALSLVQRRLLIMVDGKKTADDLRALMPGDQLDAALQHLRRAGLIQPTGQTPQAFARVTPPDLEAAAVVPLVGASMPSLEFSQVCADSSLFVRMHLGAAAEPICAAIARCENAAELRQLLHGVEIFVGDRLGAATAQTFARHFEALLA